MKNYHNTTAWMVKNAKLLFLLIFIGFSSSVYASNTSYSQSKFFTFSFKNTSIKKIFEYIEQKSELVFLYSGEVINPETKITVDAKSETIYQIMDKLLKDQSISYTVSNRQVTLKKNVRVNSPQQPKKGREIYGLVKDIGGEPIIGASIQIKGTNTGAITDLDGLYTLHITDENSVIVVSFIGYVTQEIAVKDNKTINITLKEDTKNLEEVVVTAFGVGQKKESVVGSIVQIKPTELKIPSSNLSNSFAGRLAGVTAFQRNGEPGTNGSNFYIRGISTINDAARNPLIIIDGVEASSGDLNALDTEVIESFSILKDATATAMYGTRGANGVMIVKTKNGANLEKAAISVRLEANVATPSKIPEFVDGGSYMEMFNEAVNNYGTGSVLYTQEQIDGVRNRVNPYLYPNVNWYDELFKKAAFNQNANFNVRGGSSRMDYFMNINVNHETGMLRDRSKEFYSYGNNIDIMRYTFQNNLNFHVTKTATLSLNVGAELRDHYGPAAGTGDLFGSVMNNNPVDFPTLYPVGSFVNSENNTNKYIKWGFNENSDAGNPLAEIAKGYRDFFSSTVRANVKYNQQLDFITKGLSFNTLISFKNYSYSSRTRTTGYNKYYLKNAIYSPEGDITNLLLTSYGEEKNYNLGTENDSGGDRTFYIQATLNYDRTFNKKHHVSSTLLYNQDEYSLNTVNKNDLIASLPKRKLGIATRLSYDYDHRYMIEFNMGYNGSENFAKGHRYGLFPAIAAGYNISQEKWFAPLTKVIDNLKIRASYGLVGNADAGTRFLYLPLVSLQGSPQWTTGNGDQSLTLKGPLYSRFENKDITWEVGYKTNIGVDLGLFNSLNLTLEYFKELRKDIFMRNQMIPNYLGTMNSQIYGNYGEVMNYGFEIAADYGKQINKNLSIQFKGTFSFARNEVRKYAQSFHPDYPQLDIVGQSLNKHQGYIYAGHLFKDQEEIANSPEQMISGNIGPGDIKYIDLPNKYGEADGIINTYDRKYMGHPTVPEIIYGFGPSIQWKKWDFSFYMQGAGNTSLMMSNFHPFGKYNNRNVLKFIAKDYWNSNSQNIYAAYPRLTKLDHDNNTVASNYWLRNASFLKLKNLEIGYSWKFMRAYISGANLLTFSSFKYWDPEMGGGNGLKYPTQRVFNIGVQMSFK